jgi:YebC/PmpR family DNA-binding regulatory protein
MSGHSKWATTKHKKAIVDAKRGKMFAKMVKNIEVAARIGGPDPDGNPTLYDAIQKARKSSVPKDHIDRAVKRGGGVGADAVDYTTIMYEGYAPGGVALLIECLTDNKNRAAMEVRTAMTRNGGTMADPGSVSYMFHRKGVIMVPQEQESGPTNEDDVLVAVLDAGAEEVNDLDGSFEVISEATDLVAVRTALQEAGLDHDGRRRRGRGHQDHAAHRRARGLRRRAERLRELRRLRRGHGAGRVGHPRGNGASPTA